jgi:hypothetical protein
MAALVDAGVDFEQIEQSYGGYVYGDSTSAQRVIYRWQTGIGDQCQQQLLDRLDRTWLARQAVERRRGLCACLGFEQMRVVR